MDSNSSHPEKNQRLLRLLSYNIQVGIHTRHFADYFFKSWRHFFPNKKRLDNITKISHLLKPYDFVALQEVDGGSLRSSYINQVELLAKYSNFPYWYHQCNRNLGKLAQHSNGLLSKIPVVQIINHKLPGPIPGRGAIEAVLGNTHKQLRIIVAHLSLSSRVRRQQINYLAKKIRHLPYVIIMGDLNCSSTELLEQFTRQGVTLHTSNDLSAPTFPSWAPKYQYDHILVTPDIQIVSQSVLPFTISDHLPLALDVLIPDSILSDEIDVKHYHPVRINDGLLGH